MAPTPDVHTVSHPLGVPTTCHISHLRTQQGIASSAGVCVSNTTGNSEVTLLYWGQLQLFWEHAFFLNLELEIIQQVQKLTEKHQ